MENNRLQFRHHTEVFESRDEAIKFLDSLVDNNVEGGAPLGKSKMGEPIVVDYKTVDAEGNEEIHLILAVGKVDDKTGNNAVYQYIDADNILGIATEAKEGMEENREAIGKLQEKVEELDDTMIKGVRLNGKDATITEDNIAELILKASELTLDGYQKAAELHELHDTDNIVSAFGKLEARDDDHETRIIKLENVEPDGITIVKQKPNTDSEKEYLSTTLQIIKSNENLGSNQEVRYYLADKDGNQKGTDIVINKDSFLKSVELVEKDGKKNSLEFVFMLNTGEEKKVSINIADFVQESEFDIKKGFAVENGVVSIKKDPSSEDFLSITEYGLKVSGIADAINEAASNEQERAEKEEASLLDKITAETERATEKESSLQDEIDILNGNALVEGSVDNKVEAAKTELNGTITDVKDELSNSIKTAQDTLATAITEETNRATEKEDELNGKLTTLNGNELTEGSVAYTAKEYADAEKERAEAKEAELAANIQSNTVSSKAPITVTKGEDGTTVELKISGDCLGVNGENGTLTTTLTLSYDEENNKILLLGKEDKEISSLSATPFIKHSMVKEFKTTTTEGGTRMLVIVWNDGEKDNTLEIPLNDIFAPYAASNGITIDADNNISIKKDATSDDAKYLTLGVAGLGLTGISEAIDNKITPVETRVSSLEEKMTGDTTVQGSVQHIVDDAVTPLKTQLDTLNGDAATDGSVKHTITDFKEGDLITKTVTEVTTDDAKNQTLLFAIGTGTDSKIYASNDTKDMLYKKANLEITIDDILDRLTKQEEEIAALKKKVEELGNITGKSKEIKVTHTEGIGYEIGFAEDAIFGQVNN